MEKQAHQRYGLLRMMDGLERVQPLRDGKEGCSWCEQLIFRVRPKLMGFKIFRSSGDAVGAPSVPSTNRL